MTDTHESSYALKTARRNLIVDIVGLAAGIGLLTEKAPTLSHVIALIVLAASTVLALRDGRRWWKAGNTAQNGNKPEVPIRTASTEPTSDGTIHEHRETRSERKNADRQP